MSKGVVNSRYKKRAYDTIITRIPKGVRQSILEKCKANGTTLNGIINDFLREYIGIAPEDWNYRFFADTSTSTHAGQTEEPETCTGDARPGE